MYSEISLPTVSFSTVHFPTNKFSFTITAQGKSFGVNFQSLTKSQIVLVFTALSLKFAVDLVALFLEGLTFLLTSQVCMTPLKAVTETILQYRSKVSWQLTGKAHLPKSYCWSLQILGVFNSLHLESRSQGGTPDFKWQQQSKRLFLGLKFSVLGCFWVGKFWQESFGVAWFKHNVRAHDCKYRESLARLKKSKILIICQKNPFGELSSKKIFLTFKNL